MIIIIYKATTEVTAATDLGNGYTINSDTSHIGSYTCSATTDKSGGESPKSEAENLNVVGKLMQI